jgi:hypothetical protein
MKVLVMAALAFPLTLATCESVTGCNGLVAYQALQVTARDSTTGDLVANAVLRAVGQGPDSASVSIGSNVSLYPVNLAGHGGTYVVSVQAPGYLAWMKTVIVTGGCTPTSVSVTALMQAPHGGAGIETRHAVPIL